MSEAHHEAVRLSSERPVTMGCSRQSLLPFRMRRAQTTPDIKISHRFYHPSQNLLRQVTHEHILKIGDNLLTKLEQTQEQRAHQAYQQKLEAERIRMENEYQKKSDEIARKWLAQLENEKIKLQKELDETLANMERIRKKKNQEDEQALIQRMKNECDQALARQWKLANEQIPIAVKQAEDRLRSLLELKYLEDREKFAQELIAKKDAEYAEKEMKTVERVIDQSKKDHEQNLKIIKGQHEQEINDLKKKLKSTEDRFRREFAARTKLESDFRLLQMDYKRFMDYTDFFHSDYMLKLYHIGEQIGDTKFEEILDRILTESNIEPIPSQSLKSQIKRSRTPFKPTDS